MLQEFCAHEVSLNHTNIKTMTEREVNSAPGYVRPLRIADSATFVDEGPSFAEKHMREEYFVASRQQELGPGGEVSQIELRIVLPGKFGDPSEIPVDIPGYRGVPTVQVGATREAECLAVKMEVRVSAEDLQPGNLLRGLCHGASGWDEACQQAAEPKTTNGIQPGFGTARFAEHAKEGREYCHSEIG